MSERIRNVFDACKAQNRAALIVFLTAGDPELSWTVELLIAAADAGADILEVGVPFSDPTADGVTIQQASERALKAGATMSKVLETVRQFRAQRDTPVVLFGYYNPVLSYGEEQLCTDGQAAGVDAFLVVDLPPEVAQPLLEPAYRCGLSMIPLAAPTSTAARVAQAAETAKGFLYYVSMTGVTGNAAADLEQAAVRARDIRETHGVPVAVGFGVRTPTDVQTVAQHADGVVVGSAVVREVAASSTTTEAVKRVGQLVSSLAVATKRVA